ncbi:hypothetical protein GCM10010170_104900 [Dactylosporangium salmoneum]|uniref:Uncharacterized protein n=1 Tax=Dactylosporangium salmoneum TaxID=53361 RepID=A0ABN3I2K6_9ACTN
MTVGRHSLGRPGLARRDWTGFIAEGSGSATTRRRRARHRARTRPNADTRSLFVGVTVLGMLAVSGWYTAAGASAVAQMLAR